MDVKKVIIGSCVAIVLFGALFIGASIWILPRLMAWMPSPPPEPAPEPSSPVVTKGSGLFIRELLVEYVPTGTVTDIAFADLDSDGVPEIGIAGNSGAVLLDQHYNVKFSVSFKSRPKHVDIIDVEGDGNCEFINTGHWGSNPRLFDHDGSTRWSYGGAMPGVDDMCSGDIDGDGELEFVVGFNGRGGVHLLQADGKRQWKKPDGNVWHVEMVDTDGNGSLEILHSNARGEMKIRDAEGNVLSSTRPPGFLARFSLCNWPDKTGPQRVLHLDGDKLTVLNFDANVVAKLQATALEGAVTLAATPVRLKKNEREYFAAIAGVYVNDQATLWVYDANKKLIYEETIPEHCAAIAALDLDDSGTDAILVGGQGRIYEYTLQEQKG